MKKLFSIGAILVVAIITLVLAGCPSPTSEPPVVEPPIVIPPTFEQVVLDKLWQVEGIVRLQDTRAASTPYEKGVCMLWEDDLITAFEDLNGDGFVSPGEEIASVPVTIAGGVITIDGLIWEVIEFDADGWAMRTYLDGTTAPDWIGDIGDDWTGWIEVYYVPCPYPWLDDSISYDFAFVFDDMGDTVADWDRICKWFKLDVDFDWADGFYYTSGAPADSYAEDDPVLGNHIMVVDYHDGYGDDIDSLMVVYTEAYGPMLFDWPEGLKPDHVYDMYVEVFASDMGTVEFISRVDGSGFLKDIVMDFSSMGELITRGVDDCDVNVVNPTL